MSVVGSNPWSIYILCCGIKSMIHLHRILGCGIKSMVHLHPLLWDQIHGPFICTTCTWGQIHGPIYTLYLCLFRVKCMVPFTPCTCVCLGSNAWSHLHTVGVSIVGSNPWSCTCVCCGVKCMITFTHCT